MSTLVSRFRGTKSRATKRSLISVARLSVNPADSAQYPDVHAWMLEEMERFRSVFEPRIAALPAAETVDEDEED
jgi:hypothetical protein